MQAVIGRRIWFLDRRNRPVSSKVFDVDCMGAAVIIHTDGDMYVLKPGEFWATEDEAVGDKNEAAEEWFVATNRR